MAQKTNWISREFSRAEVASSSHVTPSADVVNSADVVTSTRGSPLDGPFELSSELRSELPPLVQRFLQLRGIHKSEDYAALVDPKVSQLKDPNVLRDLGKAVDRIEQAFNACESVCIYADFDLDGSSGLALLYQGMRGLEFKDLSYYQPKRLSEGYGFHASAVEELAARGVRLIITVDVGITALEACDRARELGVDVIITDHHQPLDVLPEAFAVVNPKRKDCESGLGYLSGAGVAYYLLRALKRRWTDRGHSAAEGVNLRELLDFLTIGTLTDMVPLVEDNRALIRAGLKSLQNTQRPGLRALLEELGFASEVLTSQQVAIRFSPKLNALSRMDAGLLPIHIFLEEDPQQAQVLVRRMIAFNTERVKHQQEAEQLALQLIDLTTTPNYVFVHSERFHRGVIGLVATKLASTFGLPAFVGSLNEEGQIVGSARWPREGEGQLVEALRSCDELLERHGGHHSAAGFELRLEKVPEFQARLNEFFNGPQRTESEAIEYDLAAELAELTLETLSHFERFEPYGSAFPVPTFLVKASIERVECLRGGHLKLYLKPDRALSASSASLGGSVATIQALWFSPPPEALQMGLQKGWTVRVICEMQKNSFAGRRSLQLLIRHLALAEDGGRTAENYESQSFEI